MSTPFVDPFADDAPTQLELDRAVAKARSAFAYRAEVDALSGSGEAHGIRATVLAAGGVSALEVPDAACADGGAAVAERILDAVADAQRDLARAVQELARATFGEDSRETRLAEDGAATRFGRRGVVIEPEPDDER